MTHFSYTQLIQLAGPEIILSIAALAVLAADLLVMRDEAMPYRRMVCALFASVGCLASGVFIFAAHSHGAISDGMLVADNTTRVVKLALVLLTLFTVLISIETDFTEHVGEYFSLILMAAVGMLFMASAEELLMLFVALELTSLSLYVLAAFNKRSIKSAEAALKYFLIGGVSAAFTLYGLSLIYGLSGSTNLHEIAKALHGKGLDPLLIVAIVMTVMGFGFKIAAAPFHLWAPDAYEGAPAPSAALIASGSKVASLVLLAKVMAVGFAGAEGSGAWRGFVPGWIPALATVAALSMVLGNLAAIAQSNLRRLIAYSAIAHAGYMLLGVLSHDAHGTASLVYYSATYGAATIGIFGIIAILENHGGTGSLSDLAGLTQRAPRLAIYLMVFVLSLAGIPPLSGFFGKFYIFAAAANAGPEHLGLLWLVILAIAMSAVSLYYYLQILKQACVAKAPENARSITLLPVTEFAIAFLALAVIVLGCAPNIILGPLQTVAAATGH